ncbi:MAG: histidinol dehydrogenase [Oscillibacter sp.]|nr:histidinol dehydrogenase [Oscillibacter sp.]
MIKVEHWDGGEALFRRERVRTDPEITAAVARILDDVRKRGDAALHEYTKRFDGVDVDSFQVAPEALEAAYKSLDAGFRETLRRAAENIEQFHARQVRRDYVLADNPGILLGLRHIPMERVGICVPKSPEAFPSTILMNAIPARLAGVRDILLVTPPEVSAAALGAAYIAAPGVRVYTIGGAQAVAALAYGTESVPAVDKIVGPGGVFVAEAKRQVFGQVGIDLIAGPSEILVLADASADACHVAADMLSQAEHDTHAAAVLVTDCRELAERVAAELERQLPLLPRADIARKSLESNGRLYVADSLERAVEAANRIAPEHLELCVAEPLSLLPLIRNAGSVFLGHNAPEALGDYFAGPNHTLPTSGTARFSGPLSVDDFVKKSSFIYYTRDALNSVADRIADFAEREGLRAHARSVLLRKEESV